MTHVARDGDSRAVKVAASDADGAIAEREPQRLVALHEFGLLDTPGDDEIQAVVRVAAMIAGVPTATLNLIDEHRQCQLTSTGFNGVSSRSDSMCAIRLADAAFVHVPDASCDPVYQHNPWVTGVFAKVRFYASAPLITTDGYVVGTLCATDNAPRRLTDEQIGRLQDLAQVIVALFERRRQARRYADLGAVVEARQRLTDTVLDTIDVAVVAADPTGHLTLFNRAARAWHGMDADPDLNPIDHADRYDLYEADGVTSLAPHRVPLATALSEGIVAGAEIVIKPAGQPARHLIANGRSLIAGDGTSLGAVVAMTDVTDDRVHRRDLHHAHQQLAKAAETDPLTGLANRAGIRRWLTSTISEMHPTDDRLALAVIDLDNFKHINDSYGHSTGDAVLRGIAVSLTQGCRPGDLQGRLGGDEFIAAAILPPAVDIVPWRRRVEAAAATTVGEVTVNGSVGTIVLTAAARYSIDELIAQADLAMYQRKTSRREAQSFKTDLAEAPTSLRHDE